MPADALADRSRAISKAARARLRNAPPKDAGLAVVLGLLFPGGGQVYGERFEGAVLVFVIETGLILLAIAAANAGSVGFAVAMALAAAGVGVWGAVEAYRQVVAFNVRRQRG